MDSAAGGRRGPGARLSAAPALPVLAVVALVASALAWVLVDLLARRSAFLSGGLFGLTVAALIGTFMALPVRLRRQILAGVVDLARRVGLPVVVEGIEDAAGAWLAQELRADRGQGFWLGRPQPWPELDRAQRAG